MVTRVSLQNYRTRIPNNSNHNPNYGVSTANLGSSSDYIDSTTIEEVNHRVFPTEIDRISDGDDDDVDRDAVTVDGLDQDEGSNTVDCLDERYKDHMHIPNIGIEDDRSSLESSGSLRNSCHGLTTNDVLPIEAARARFLRIIVDNFISTHLIEKWGAYVDETPEPGVDKMNKRKSGESIYEGDPRFAMPLMYVANLYETLVNEVNLKLASLTGLRDKTIGVSLEASGGLYRKLTQKFPKSGSYSFKRRELATSMETRKKFPELVVQEEKRVRFVVANGLNIIEKPLEMPSEDAEWFKRLTGRTEVAIAGTDYKFYNPRHKVRRSSFNPSPTISGLPSYHGSSDHEFQSASENPGEQVTAVTPPKQHVVTVACQPQYQPILLNHHQSHNRSATLISCSHESGQSSHLHDIAHLHESPTLSQNMAASEDPLSGSHVRRRLNMMPPSPAKFCDECGSPYVRPTSKFCSQCGTKRFGI